MWRTDSCKFFWLVLPELPEKSNRDGTSMARHEVQQGTEGTTRKPVAAQRGSSSMTVGPTGLEKRVRRAAIAVGGSLSVLTKLAAFASRWQAMDIRRRSSVPSGLSRLEREREREIKTAFETFAEGEGVGYHELKAAMRALMLPVKKADVLEAMRASGHSPDDVLDFKAFAQIIQRKFAERDPLAAMLQTFRLFDSSGSGRLSLRDLRKAVKETQLPIQEHETLGLAMRMV
eukprot:Skav222963  [mRNA]  locus=scaffold1489:789756:796094:- [translate_table: standard]